MIVLLKSSGEQKRTFGFDSEGLDFNPVLLAWLSSFGRENEVLLGLGNWGGRQLNGNLSRLLGV